MTTTTPSPNGKLNSTNLGHHGLSFDETCCESTPLPSHVNYVRDVLLNFDHILDRKTKKIFAKDMAILKHYDTELPYPEALCPPKEAYAPDSRMLTIEAKHDEALSYAQVTKAESIANEMRDNLKRKASEEDWVSSLRQKFFREFRKQPEFTESSHKQLFDGYTMHKNELWSSARNYPPYKSEEEHRLSSPKPDFTYAFEIYRNTEHRKGLWQGNVARNFSLQTLQRLQRAGLISSPGQDLTKLTPDSQESDFSYTCFPWAIVESKKQNVGVLKSKYQAINAASVALRMLDGLMSSRYYRHTGENEDIPPVIVFTTIGQNVTLWLAYKRTAKTYTMTQVWQTSLLTTWGVVTLHQVIKNMHIWATRELKPKICDFLGRWYFEHLASPPSSLPSSSRTEQHLESPVGQPRQKRNPSKQGPGRSDVSRSTRRLSLDVSALVIGVEGSAVDGGSAQELGSESSEKSKKSKSKLHRNRARHSHSGYVRSRKQNSDDESESSEEESPSARQYDFKRLGATCRVKKPQIISDDPWTLGSTCRILAFR